MGSNGNGRIDAVVFNVISSLFTFGSSQSRYGEVVLRELRSKYKIGAISVSKITETENRKRIIEGVKPYVDVMITETYRTGMELDYCIGMLNVKRENTLVVDDHKGVDFANRLGCKTALLERAKYANRALKEGEPSYRIRSVEDLLKILL